MWKICSKLFKICLKSVTYDQLVFKVWRQYVRRLSKFPKYIPKLLKICLTSIGNLFQICPDSVHHLSNVSLKSCKRICHYPSKSAKIYRIVAEILLKVWPKFDLQNLSNNCPNYAQNMFEIYWKSVQQLCKLCSKYVQNLSTIGLQYNTNGRNFIESGKFCRLFNIMLKICSKPV